LDFSFEGLYQCIRRSYRFGQLNQVDIHIISTDTMRNVSESIKTKETQFDLMKKNMIKHSSFKKEYSKMKINVSDVINEKYKAMHGDCVERIKEIDSESVGFSIFSPPFASLYTYSDHPEDMGNCKNYDEFVFVFNEMVKELYRIMWSGRNVAVHCMDLPIQKGKEGYIGLRDFSGMIREVFLSHGFIYHSRITIWKDPVTEMQRTKALGLLHKQVKKDSSMSRVGIPDYLMVFRKDGEHKHPVKCNIDVDTWQKYASPVWMDIDYSDTLNAREARSEKDERHICPLQLETIKRSIHLWSNPGDVVFTPFMGIGSEVYQAIIMKRFGIGIELKEQYFATAVSNIESAIEKSNQTSLFD
jgi:DNA modification methylase